jgi:hypothetical protein
VCDKDVIVATASYIYPYETAVPNKKNSDGGKEQYLTPRSSSK